MSENISIQKHKKVGLTEIVSLVSLYSCAIFNFEPSIYKIFLWVAIPISFILCFIKYNTISRNFYVRLILILFAWCSFTALTAQFPELAAKEIQTIIGVFLYCYITGSLCTNPRIANWVFGVYLVLLINCSIYAYNHLYEMVISSSGKRLSDENLNANMFGYLLVSVTFIIFYWGCISRGFYRKLTHILFFVLIPASFIIATLTASRQILILEVPMISIYLYYRYGKLNPKSVFMGVIIIVAIGYVGVKYGADYYAKSELAARSEVKAEDDPRAVLVKDAIKLGCEHPLMGAGPGNFKKFTPEGCFSHNSYLELFANSGIIASLIYIVMVLSFILSMKRKLKDNNADKLLLKVFIVYGIFYAIDNVFYVFYLNVGLLSFYVSVVTLAHSRLQVKYPYAKMRRKFNKVVELR